MRRCGWSTRRSSSGCAASSSSAPPTWCFPGAVHTRFEHSIGTLHMTDRMVEAVNRNARHDPAHCRAVDDEERTPAALRALLHDVTHVPFGHNIEDQTGLAGTPRHPGALRRHARPAGAAHGAAGAGGARPGAGDPHPGGRAAWLHAPAAVGHHRLGPARLPAPRRLLHRPAAALRRPGHRLLPHRARRRADVRRLREGRHAARRHHVRADAAAWRLATTSPNGSTTTTPRSRPAP